MSPDCSAFSVAVVSVIGLNVTASRYGPPAEAFQYDGFLVSVTWSPLVHSLNTNGPVPTRAGGPPCAYLLFLKSGALAFPSVSAFGLAIANGVSVWVTRKPEFGDFRVITNVPGSGAAVEAMALLAPCPRTVSM